ncbi:hypothetical protein Tco_0604631 [Tanacetum coccineum]
MFVGLMYLTASRPNIAFATFDSGFELIAYSDADLAGCNDDCKSTSGGIQFLGDKLVSWSLKKQDCTAMSTAEAEYVSLSTCCAQVIWMRMQLLDYGFRYNKILMYCDSQSTIAISCNLVQLSTIELYFIGMEYQLADLFTKGLPKERFEYLVYRIVFHMAQQIVPAAQLVSKFQRIRRCNNYAMLQSIPCSPECKLLGKSYLIILETPENPFVAPVNIHTIEAFMNRVGYQGVTDKMSAFYTKKLAQPWQTLFKDFINCVSQKKNYIQYPHFTKLIIADLMKKYETISLRIEEDYHSIKDDILLYEMVFVGVDVPMNQPQSVVSTQGTHRLELVSHKENPEHVDDDDDKKKVDEKKDDEMGSFETRTEEMQTPIPTTPRSHRTLLSSDNNITQELMDTVSLPTATTSKEPHSKRRISSKYSHLPEDDAPPEGEKRVKRHKTSKSLKSVRGSSSKQSGKDSTTYVSKQQQQQQEWDARVKERVIDKIL